MPYVACMFCNLFFCICFFSGLLSFWLLLIFAPLLCWHPFPCQIAGTTMGDRPLCHQHHLWVHRQAPEHYKNHHILPCHERHVLSQSCKLLWACSNQWSCERLLMGSTSIQQQCKSAPATCQRLRYATGNRKIRKRRDSQHTLASIEYSVFLAPHESCKISSWLLSWGFDLGCCSDNRCPDHHCAWFQLSRRCKLLHISSTPRCVDLPSNGHDGRHGPRVWTSLPSMW